jgi:hypothetical protein
MVNGDQGQEKRTYPKNKAPQIAGLLEERSQDSNLRPPDS